MEHILLKPQFKEEPREVSKEKREKIEALFADTEFFERLGKATTREEIKISEEQLYYLYEGIRLWAEKNNVYPFFKTEDYYSKTYPACAYYRVKIGNLYYKIGQASGDDDREPWFFWSYAGIVGCDVPFIELDDVIAGVNLEKIQTRLSAWKQLHDAIEALKGLGLNQLDVQNEVDSLTYYVYTKDM